ncbi:MAG: methyltransferase domain-containing protein [Cyclobacteriaceae bacterium]
MSNSQLNRFDRVVPFYDALANFVFGRSLKQSRECNLEEVAQHADVLVLGGGTGKWLNKLLDGNKDCRVWYVEASGKMMNEARKNLKGKDQVVFIHGTQETVYIQKFDVVITHFFVDMFTDMELRVLADKISGDLKDGGKWIVADFVNEKIWHWIFLKGMYLFFNIMGVLDLGFLSDWEQIIKEKGFKSSSVCSFYSGFIRSIAFVKQ